MYVYRATEGVFISLDQAEGQSECSLLAASRRRSRIQHLSLSARPTGYCGDIRRGLGRRECRAPRGSGPCTRQGRSETQTPSRQGAPREPHSSTRATTQPPPSPETRPRGRPPDLPWNAACVSQSAPAASACFIAVTAESCRLPPTQGLRAKKQALYKRCAVSGLRMGLTSVFLRVSCDTFILINTRGRSSVGRAPALQVDKPKRCALVRFRRWPISAEARIIRSSLRTQDRLRGPIGWCWSIKPSSPDPGA
ncbi:MAG: hypothetical protein JWL57_3866 [Actinobacteria bacterium]|nr:hypothetical protein [Actinomycetota bacterium]